MPNGKWCFTPRNPLLYYRRCADAWLKVLQGQRPARRELPILPDSWLEGHVGYQVTVPDVVPQCMISAHFRHQAAVRIVLDRDDP
jgi:hypothetical protein